MVTAIGYCLHLSHRNQLDHRDIIVRVPNAIQPPYKVTTSMIRVHSALILLSLCGLLVENKVEAFVPTAFRNLQHGRLHCKGGSHRTAIFGTGSSAGDLDRELDKFFELAAESGFENIKNMTPEERVERVIRGEILENEIFDLRSELMQAEDDIMSGRGDMDITAVKAMRGRMDALKNEYKDIVGAKDLPLYFGRLADSMQ